MTIGYVGLGAMGKALAGRLADAGEVLAWDINPHALQQFAACGAASAHSLADLGARSDVVLLCLPKSAHVEQALFGASGLAESLAPGTIVIDQTSGEPARTREFAARLAAQGVTLIDAPVSGGVPSAVAGNITIMASGDEDAFDRALPVLRAMSANVFRCSGTVGDGQAVKAINNLVNSANRIATLEIVAAGRWLGLDVAAMADALNAGPGRSFITSRLLPAIVERRSSTDFSLALMVKDLNQAADLDFAHGEPMPVSEAARGLINVALGILGENARLDDLVTFMERVMQTRFVGTPPAAPLEGQGTKAELLQLIVSTIAASNRLIMCENVGLAKRTGIDLPVFEQIMLCGSAASAEAEALLATLSGRTAPDNRTVDSLVDDLTRLARLGARCGIPLLMTNEVRTQCLRYAGELGRGAPVAAIR